MNPIEQAALDLLNCGPTSVAVLGGEIVSRGLLSKEQTIGHAYAEARNVLAQLAKDGRAKQWPCGIVFTLPDSAAIETKKERP